MKMVVTVMGETRWSTCKVVTTRRVAGVAPHKCITGDATVHKRVARDAAPHKHVATGNSVASNARGKTAAQAVAADASRDTAVAEAAPEAAVPASKAATSEAAVTASEAATVAAAAATMSKR
jgi:hypothetical protein